MRQNIENFSLLHNRLYGKVFSYVSLRVKNTDEVKDIVQDVFLKAYKSLSEKEYNENAVKNYLFMIARQRMIDLWRSGRNRYYGELYNKGFDGEEDEQNNFDELEGDSPLPEEIFEDNEKKKYVLELLNKLKKSDREILILRFLEEMEYKELARVYKTSEENIRQKVSRSLQNLRKVAENK